MDDVGFESKARWKIEDLYEEIKQLRSIFLSILSHKNLNKLYSLCYVSLNFFEID